MTEFILVEMPSVEAYDAMTPEQQHDVQATALASVTVIFMECAAHLYEGLPPEEVLRSFVQCTSFVDSEAFENDRNADGAHDDANQELWIARRIAQAMLSTKLSFDQIKLDHERREHSDSHVD